MDNITVTRKIANSQKITEECSKCLKQQTTLFYTDYSVNCIEIVALGKYIDTPLNGLKHTNDRTYHLYRKSYNNE